MLEKASKMEILKSLIFKFELNPLPKIDHEITVRKAKIETLLNKLPKGTDKRQINRLNCTNYSIQSKNKNNLNKISIRNSRSTITTKNRKTKTSLFQNLTEDNSPTVRIPRKQTLGVEYLSFRTNKKENSKKGKYDFESKQNKKIYPNFYGPNNSRNVLTTGFSQTSNFTPHKIKKLSHADNYFRTYYINNNQIINENNNRKSTSYSSSKKKLEVSPQIIYEYNAKNQNNNNNIVMNNDLSKTDKNYYSKTFQSEDNKSNINSSDLNKNIGNNELTKQIFLINKETSDYFNKLSSILNSKHSKTKKKINKIEKLIRKNEIKVSILDILKNKKQKKINFSSKLKKIREQVSHLETVDKINKLPDNYPAEQIGEFNRAYSNKVKQIGISDKNIVLSNGKLYHQSKCESNVLCNSKENYKKVNKLLFKLQLDKSDCDKQAKKSEKLFETVHKEKFNLTHVIK